MRVDFELQGDRPANLCMHQTLPDFGQTVDRGLVARALSLEEEDISEDLPPQIISCGFPFVVVMLNSLDAVGRARARADLLETEFADLDSQQVLITTTETVAPESDVHCRMFAPLLGVPEDPATGSAHGPLGAYLFTHGIFDFSDRSLVSEQGVEMGRPRLEV